MRATKGWGHRLRYVAALAIAASIGVPGVAGAVASRCTAKKFTAAARYFQERTKCVANAVKNDEAVDATCLARAVLRFTTLWSKAELPGDCITLADRLLVRDDVDGFVDALGGRLLGIATTTSTTSLGCRWPSVHGPVLLGSSFRHRPLAAQVAIVLQPAVLHRVPS
jgi:hypothetical protein